MPIARWSRQQRVSLGQYSPELIMAVEHFQNLVIGCGVAGRILAWTLAKQGQKTVVVERSMIGGSCVNVACLPSKNVIYSAKAVVQTAILGGMPYTALRGAIFTHPTMAEG